MDVYEKWILKQITLYENSLSKTSFLQHWSKHLQQKVDQVIPQGVHRSFALALEKGIKAFLQGLHLVESDQLPASWRQARSLHQQSEIAKEIVEKYKKLASVEGAVTGFGGLIASTIDFPALISIKLKLMQEIALLFGYRLSSFEERVFILKIFLLQFSGSEVKQRIWREIKAWESEEQLNERHMWDEFNWEEFYMEYKQSIELRKLFQLIPGFGAVVGAWANYSFLDDLGETAILCYQLRKITEKYGEQ